MILKSNIRDHIKSCIKGKTKCPYYFIELFQNYFILSESNSIVMIRLTIIHDATTSTNKISFVR